jgi:hypothetical protein
MKHCYRWFESHLRHDYVCFVFLLTCVDSGLETGRAYTLPKESYRLNIGFSFLELTLNSEKSEGIIRQDGIRRGIHSIVLTL